VDLQSSFQLHLSSSESTFDLLNEKISFFSSKDDNDSFLHNLENDDSFSDADFVPSKPSTEEVVVSRKASPTQGFLPEVQGLFRSKTETCQLFDVRKENTLEDFPTDLHNIQRADVVIREYRRGFQVVLGFTVCL
jgi:hypothetical protein